jgi:chromosome segregation ATPase
MLEAFVRHGVPVEATTDSMFANIANAVAEILTKSVAYAQSVNDITSANTQYLAQENQSLREQLHHIGDGLSTLDEKYHMFVKRSSQKEIGKSLREFHAKVDKLREPDVTLENMAKQIKQFERAQFRQNETIDNFKASCDKELDKVCAIRRKFNKEAKDQTAKRKDDLKDLKVGIAHLEERLEAIEHQMNDVAGAQYSPDPQVQSNATSIDELHEEIRILRQHITAMENDDRRKWTGQAAFNKAMSQGVTKVYNYQFGDV